MQNDKSKFKIIIFTDLDGTLLDHETYSFEEAKPALEKAKETGTPVIFVTSKTFAEVEALQKKMGLWGKEPFIVENGGAIFIPEKEKFRKIEFGKSYEEVRKVLKEVADEAGLKVQGIGDMTAEEFSRDCGLPLEDAERAKQRMYQEGFKILGVPVEQQKEAQERIRAAIEKRGLNMSVGGRYCQIMGERPARQNRSTSRERIVQKRRVLRLGGAKVKAVKILIDLFRKKYGEIVTIGLGDAQADLEFMELCDQGFLIKNPKKAVGAEIESDKIHRVEEEGPAGWNKVVLSQLSKAST